MRRLAVCLVCLCSIVAVPARAIPLSYFPTELTPLDPGGVLDKVDVYISGKEPYNTYFLQVAVVGGTMAVADALTSQFGQALGAVAGEAVGTDPAQWPDVLKKLPDEADKPDEMELLRKRGHQLEAVIDPVVRAVEQMPGLAAQGADLVTRAPQDYTGLRGRLKLVGVMNALRKSGGQMGGAVMDSKRTLENLRAIVSAMPR